MPAPTPLRRAKIARSASRFDQTYVMSMRARKLQERRASDQYWRPKFPSFGNVSRIERVSVDAGRVL